MNTPLHDLMYRAVEDADPDLDRLAVASRRRGLAIRRRRQALSAVGAAAVVATIAVGAAQLLTPSPSGTAATSTTEPEPTPRPSSAASRQVPQTGPAVAAALDEAVRDVVGPFYGGLNAFKGQGSGHEGTYAEMHLQPSDRGGFSLVGINVQPAFGMTEIYRCRDWQLRCQILHPTKGATLMTYEEHSQTVDGLGVRVVADLLRADGVRVVASSSNGEELPANRWDVTRERPPLTATQLYLVVSKPWWGAEMDERFAVAGNHMSDYEEIDDSIDSSPILPRPGSPTK